MSGALRRWMAILTFCFLPSETTHFVRHFALVSLRNKEKRARVSVRTRRSTGHAFFGKVVHQWQSLELFGPHDTLVIFTRLLLTRLEPRAMLLSRTCNALGLGSALRKGVWDCARLLTKLLLLTLFLATPRTSCALGSDTAIDGIKTRVISICKVP